MASAKITWPSQRSEKCTISNHSGTGATATRPKKTSARLSTEGSTASFISRSKSTTTSFTRSGTSL
ncbi:MAG: hypothetical protein D6818_03600, partial [Bacteroidetes bacterium]